MGAWAGKRGLLPQRPAQIRAIGHNHTAQTSSLCPLSVPSHVHRREIESPGTDTHCLTCVTQA